MQSDIEVILDGRRIFLRNVGDEMWASGLFVCNENIVVRRTNGLYQADVGHGTAAWFDTAQEAVTHAQRDAENQPSRSAAQRDLFSLFVKEAAE
jgi:hypothetical protein